MVTLLLRWTLNTQGNWQAEHPIIQGTDAPAYRLRPAFTGYIAEYQGEAVGEVLASVEDAGWSASMHAFHDLRVRARYCPHARAILDAIAAASLDALHRSPLGGRASK